MIQTDLGGTFDCVQKIRNEVTGNVEVDNNMLLVSKVLSHLNIM